MWDNKTYRLGVREGWLKPGRHKLCNRCGEWVDNRNHQRHLRACNRKARLAKEAADEQFRRRNP